MNVTLRILDMFLKQDSISHTLILRDIELTVSVTRLWPQFFFSKTIFSTTKKVEKIHMDSERSINSFRMKKR